MAPISVGARVNKTCPTQSLVDSYLTISGKTITEEGTDYNSNLPYANRDPRLTATVVYDGYKWKEMFDNGPAVIRIDPASGSNDALGASGNSTATGYYMAKYYSPQAEGDLASGINLIMMRYADVLLMYAEAKLESDGMTEDVWNKTLYAIRHRAGFRTATALEYPSAQSKNTMRQIIRNERRVELAMEGLRWWDIKRWKAGKEYLNGKIYSAQFPDRNAILLDTYNFDETRDYLWAVPQSQINLNKNLTPNNPGYSN